MFRGKIGKFPYTDFHCETSKHVKLVTHYFFANCDVGCSCSGSLHLNGFVCFWQGVENGIPAYVCDPAASHHTGNAVHCNHGEGSSHIKDMMFVCFNCLYYFITATHPPVCILSNLSLKSWWVWNSLENSDLWYNCRFDNHTETWLCASSKETGKQQCNFVYVPKIKSANQRLVFRCGNVFLSQSGIRQCRSWWFSRWSSPRSPSWCSWVNCLPCLRVDSSTSLGCVKSFQVTLEWNNVPPTWWVHLKRVMLALTNPWLANKLNVETGPSIFLYLSSIKQ